MLEQWVLEKWDYVVMAKNIPTYKLKVSIREKFLQKPTFHYSIIPLFHVGGIIWMPLKSF